MSSIEKKKKAFSPKIILANRLADGRVVFFTKDNGWSAQVSESVVANTFAEELALLRVATISENTNDVIGILAINADLSHGSPRPAHIKFNMQANGPSVRPDLGYQAKQFEG